MWLGFNKHILFIMLLLPVLGLAQNDNGLLYNLKQNWVQYDEDAKSFMPAISQNTGNTISFMLDGEQYEHQLLYINNSNEVHLFYKKILLQKLRAGEHYLDIDSIASVVKTSKPILSLYGKDIKNRLTTLIVSNSFLPQEKSSEEGYFKNKSFTSFFIIISIFLLGALALIKFRSNDLFSQYANVSRAFNFTTIDEIIYKGGFFINPSVQLVSWMSVSAAFILYYLIAQLNINVLEISWVEQSTMAFHLVYLLTLSVGFFVLFVVRYLLVSLVASIFDMSSIRNIHFATHLRLTFYLLLVLQVIITLDYFSVLPFNTVAILIIVFGSLFSIIVLIGIRLSFIIRHPFVQIFLYLCGTEIFLFVFVFKLVVG